MIPPESADSPLRAAGSRPSLGREDSILGPDDFETQSHASSRGHGSTQLHDPAAAADHDGLDPHGEENTREGAGDGHDSAPLDKDGRPAWSEMKTKAGKERKRLPLACIACRRKKIRCSGEKPACKHCTRSRIPCVYKVTTRKAAPRTDYMAMLDKRLKRMEDRVIKTIPKDETRDMHSIGRSVVKPSAQAPTSKAQKKRSADEAFAVEIESWAQEDRRPLHETFPMNREAKSNDGTGLLTEGAEYLPSLEIQEHLAEVFFDCVYGQSYLLLHKPSFMRRLKAGSVPPVLILAVCAVSARFSTHPQLNSDPPFLRGENWANPAAVIALSRHDEPNITILTVFLLLGLHEFGTCHGGRSWSFGGQALRMAYALQLHQELESDPLLGKGNGAGSQLSFTDREIRRRTMWACYLMDRYNSSGSQRPPIGNDRFLQIQLPIKESHFQMEIPGPTEDLDGEVLNPVPDDSGQISNARENMGVSAYIIRAIVIWGRIVDYLNLGGKRKDPHPLWHPSSVYMQLKRQIEEFSASLPGVLAFNYENLQIHAAEKIANQFIFLHIITHQNMLFLNQFAIPLAPGGRPPRGMPKPFLSNAGRAAVEAAHHISVLFDRASAYPLTVPFAGYCAYTASTVHIWGIFSKNAQLEARSKENLRHTYRYLNKMKKYWGMFHYMVESAKDRYRQFADAAIRGSGSAQDGSSLAPMFQYGDWFDKYPHGVSRVHWEDPGTRQKESGEDAVMGQKPDLQSVEDFFASLSPTPRPSIPRRSRPRKNSRFSDGTSNSNMEQSPSQSLDLPLSGNTANVPASTFPQPSLFPPDATMSFGQPPFDFSIPPDQLPQLDRQFVYGSFADFDPANFVTSSNPAIPPPPPMGKFETQAPDQHLFTGHLDPGAPSGTGEYYQPSAWFLPFNLDPLGGGPPQSVGDTAAAPGPGSDFPGLGSVDVSMDGFGLCLGRSTRSDSRR
ncbi:hypothetical protein N7539_007171 [Penicillium diatomitis]|uniref:Zn(2)-C6 fungal-type domain-containing protein n=1 Tax=Penicillium diatomitis TaxID=2819901 RepID=A0A9W9WUS1_9EURO|nr:uncharacterized protein N7539_007171 [Penicillium diatomitis]KAJ5477027.1 hypothetical protein N7539_007171 [Penicillium diatomitis]